jgi:two-component system sensor histidine kinase KdpD
MTRTLVSYVEALLAVAAIVWLTTTQLALLGLASSALLFLLPVLFVAVRGGRGPALLAALAGAVCYNFFLLEPRFTLRVHQFENLVSIFVLVAVALVTSRLASRLLAREAEAQERASLNHELAQISALLSGSDAEAAFKTAREEVERRYGTLLILTEPLAFPTEAGSSALHLSAAAWARHNGDITGHGSTIMATADWSFFPLTFKNGEDGRVVALARPLDGTTRSQAQLAHLRQLCLLLGQHLDREALDEARRARALLEERDRLRRTFLASLAHDFRTPLTVISGRLAEIARRNPEAIDALTAAKRLDRMMTDLIGAARIEAGALSPKLEGIDIVDVISASCDDQVSAGDVRLVRSIPADLPFAQGDPVMLQHILSNLLDNALRHARHTVTLVARHVRDEIILQICDDGPGIPKDARGHIFHRFTRLEGSDRDEGNGLGLAIVKGFADAMGMTVAIDEPTTGGARFSLYMPVLKGNAE